MVPTALILDDQEFEVRLIDGILKSAGFKTFHAGTIDQADILLEQKVPHLLIVDICLDHATSGLDWLETVRKTKFSNIPVIVMSASRDALAVHRSIGLGATDYIIKPSDYICLKSKLQRIYRHIKGASYGITFSEEMPAKAHLKTEIKGICEFGLLLDPLVKGLESKEEVCVESELFNDIGLRHPSKILMMGTNSNERSLDESYGNICRTFGWNDKDRLKLRRWLIENELRPLVAGFQRSFLNRNWAKNCEHKVCLMLESPQDEVVISRALQRLAPTTSVTRISEVGELDGLLMTDEKLIVFSSKEQTIRLHKEGFLRSKKRDKENGVSCFVVGSNADEQELAQLFSLGIEDFIELPIDDDIFQSKYISFAADGYKTPLKFFGKRAALSEAELSWDIAIDELSEDHLIFSSNINVPFGLRLFVNAFGLELFVRLDSTHVNIDSKKRKYRLRGRIDFEEAKSSSRELVRKVISEFSERRNNVA